MRTTRERSETRPRGLPSAKLTSPAPAPKTAASFCYIENVPKLTWLALFVLAMGTLLPYVHPPRVDAQEESEPAPEVEVITEPPPQPEAPPSEPPEQAPPPTEAPPKPAPPKKKPGHLRVGGGIGFGFSTGFVSVAVAPQVSYIFKKIVEPGVSFRYQYSKDRVVVPAVTWHTYGGSIFTRIFPIESLFLLIEGEIINTGWTTGDVSSGRRNYGNLLLGGGYLVGVGRGAFMGVSMKFAVFRNPFYPNAFPIFSVGAGYAF